MRPATIRVRPIEGRAVRHPDGRPLEEAGEWVTNHPYWRRRLDDGDVSIELPRRTAKRTSA